MTSKKLTAAATATSAPVKDFKREIEVYCDRSTSKWTWRLMAGKTQKVLAEAVDSWVRKSDAVGMANREADNYKPGAVAVVVVE